jgi:hypothetical protein
VVAAAALETLAVRPRFRVAQAAAVRAIMSAAVRLALQTLVAAVVAGVPWATALQPFLVAQALLLPVMLAQHKRPRVAALPQAAATRFTLSLLQGLFIQEQTQSPKQLAARFQQMAHTFITHLQARALLHQPNQ